MKTLRITLAAVLLAVAMGSTTAVRASQDAPKPMQGAANLTHLHDFDFLVGDWQVHHRQLKARLAGSNEWIEFDGTCSMRKLMNGMSNVDDNVIEKPSGTYRGVGLRSYDPASGLWAIWWLDSREPFANLDPPVKGNFVNGVGTFYANDTLNGKPIRVRFIWSHITPTSAQWEQAYSPDGGKTWETNWVMQFQRVR
jgi:hypothetical protein